MNRISTDPDQPQSALATARLLWTALLLGQAVLLFGACAFTLMQMGGGQTDTGHLLSYIALFMCLTMIPAGYVLRAQMYKRHWVGQAVRPRGYLLGNVILWAMCEGISLLGLVSVVLSGELIPNLIPTVLALGVLVVNFPNGAAMFGHGSNNPYEHALKPRPRRFN
ncbi:MAG: hypothetical protein HC898_04090 [Phycisphaerales bacterium]|nr:hypothetical protein [Phycisphaerales bacterium]